MNKYLKYIIILYLIFISIYLLNLNLFENFESVEHFTYVAGMAEIIKKDASLNMPLYVKSANQDLILKPTEAFLQWTNSSEDLKSSMNQLLNIL